MKFILLPFFFGLFLLLTAFKILKEEDIANENKNGGNIARFFKI
jgi:hypothetical protein